MARTAAPSRAPTKSRSSDPLNPETVATARLFKVLSDPTRLAIVRLLLERQRSVGELVEIIAAPQSRISNHLACLRWCQFVEVDRVSRRAIYRIAGPRPREVLAAAEPVSRDRCDHLSSCTRIGPAWT
jgi:ArsR family transcriptional regulator, cadmium/lead-responsive transcriptional repressor